MCVCVCVCVCVCFLFALVNLLDFRSDGAGTCSEPLYCWPLEKRKI